MTKPTHPFLVAQDLSALSQISLGAAIPIFAKADIPLALAPTSLLSAQTEGFGSVHSQPMVDWLKAAFAHWQREDLQLTGALLGYLGSVPLIQLFDSFLTTAHLPFTLIDPVMGDGGKLYPNISPDHVTAMRQLIGHASVITPNLTEAQFLTGLPVTHTVTAPALKALFSGLRQLTGTQAKLVITGIPGADHDAIQTAWQGDPSADIQSDLQNRLPGHFYGSGDVFSAVLAVLLKAGQEFEQALPRAISLTQIALKQTAHSDCERRFGLRLSQLLDAL